VSRGGWVKFDYKKYIRERDHDEVHSPEAINNYLLLEILETLQKKDKDRGVDCKHDQWTTISGEAYCRSCSMEIPEWLLEEKRTPQV